MENLNEEKTEEVLVQKEVVENEAEQTKEKTEDKAEKPASLLTNLILMAVFAWNTYAIFNNFSVRDGYFWAILGIIINLAIIVIYSGFVFEYVESILPKEKAEKLKKYAKFINYGVYAVIFIIFAFIGHKTTKEIIAKESKHWVNDYIEYYYGEDAYECKKTKVLGKVGDIGYSVRAYFENDEMYIFYVEYDKPSKEYYIELVN